METTERIKLKNCIINNAKDMSFDSFHGTYVSLLDFGDSEDSEEWDIFDKDLLTDTLWNSSFRGVLYKTSSTVSGNQNPYLYLFWFIYHNNLENKTEKEIELLWDLYHGKT